MAAPLMNEVARDYTTDGIPSSGVHEIRKRDLRAWGTWVEKIIQAFLSNGGTVAFTRAQLFTNLEPNAFSMAWVVQDPVAENNGIYQRSGNDEVPWFRVADLPYSFIAAEDDGEGTPNAIQASSAIPVSGSALILLSVFETNTGSPVTVSFNGGPPLTIKSNSGNDIVAGGLVEGMVVAGRISGSTFRLLSDQVSSALLAEVESLAGEAKAARDEAVAAAAAVDLPPLVPAGVLAGNSDGNASIWVDNGINVKLFGAKGDGKEVSGNLTISAGGNSLTVSGASFTSADVGKHIHVPGAGASGQPLRTTIASRVSATVITLAAAAVTALSASAQTIVYGSNDAPAVQAAIDLAVFKGGDTVFFPAGRYWFPMTGPAYALNPKTGGIRFQGAGAGATILQYDGGEGFSQLDAGSQCLMTNIDSRAWGNLKKSLIFDGLHIKSTQFKFDRHRGGNAMWLDYYEKISIQNCVISNSPNAAIDLHFLGSFEAFNNIWKDNAGDCIRVRDTPNCVARDNWIIRNGDDAISFHMTAGSIGSWPIRGQMTVEGNHIINGGQIQCLGFRRGTIRGNTMRWPNIGAISLGGLPEYAEGTIPMMDIIIADNIINDCVVMTGSTPGDTAGVIKIFTGTAPRGTALSGNAIPGNFSTTQGGFVLPWDFNQRNVSDATQPVVPNSGIVIARNIIRRTAENVATYSLYGFGTRVWQGVEYNPAMTDAAYRAAQGIAIYNGGGVYIRVDDNILEHLQTGISFAAPASHQDYKNVRISRNNLMDIRDRGILVGSAAFAADITIDGNIIDCDHFRRNANSAIDGSYLASGLPIGIDVGATTGTQITRNTFKNCCLMISANDQAMHRIEDNVGWISGTPAIGFSTANRGVGVVEYAGERFSYTHYTGNPSGGTYGNINNLQAKEAIAAPSSGFYVAGAFVKNRIPTIVGGKVLTGWMRLTTGNTHGGGTDWANCYTTVA